jgi:serine/threonine-protein kinase SRPK3
VTLEALRADDSSRPPNETPELVVLRSPLHAAFPDSEGGFKTIEDHFIMRGPNGTHLFLISPLAGPRVLAMADCPGRVSGSRRLRGDLARKVAKRQQGRYIV